MKDIDWSKAPEGATHYLPGRDGFTGRFYNLDKLPPLVDFCEGTGWQLSVNGPRGSWMERLVSRPTTPQWNGEGLPPVGLVCEVSLPYCNPKDWREIALQYISDEAVVATIDGSEYAYSRAEFDNLYDTFRPIRTPEQTAAEERDKELLAISNAIRRAAHIYDDTDDLDVRRAHFIARYMHDAGYRMTAEDKR